MSASHEELAALASAYALGALDEGERQAFETHLESCVVCRADVEQWYRVTAALAYAAPPAEPSPIVRARVLSGVAVTPAETARRSTVTAAPSPTPRSTVTAAPRRGFASSTKATAWLPLAATVALAIGLGAYAVALRARVASLEVRLAEATSRMLVADAAAATARRVALQTSSVVDVLTSPDLARIDLAGQPSSPSARGRALWSRQRGMVFTASDLPPLAEGRVYQVWVVTSDSRLSAGLITPDASGRSSAVFETPPDIPMPVAVAVTIEPAGGVPQPTGAFYLLGKT